MDKVLICGLGAVGMTYAVKFKNSPKCILKILVDKNRLEKFTVNKPIFNGEEQDFDYILPDDNWSPDLIIISTKYQGLNDCINCIKNYVNENTTIISLINGISSENVIKESYPHTKILKSYFIGHSAVRNGNSVTQDGFGKIIIEKNDYIEELLKRNSVDYETKQDIDYSMWLKFTLNLFSNPVSAILNATFGDLKNSQKFISFAKEIINEVKLIAQKEGIKNLENLEQDAFEALNMMSDDGKTSTLQDILAKKKTEIDIFSGDIVRLGKKYGISTPYNKILYDLVKIKEEINEFSIHSR